MHRLNREEQNRGCTEEQCVVNYHMQVVDRNRSNGDACKANYPQHRYSCSDASQGLLRKKVSVIRVKEINKHNNHVKMLYPFNNKLTNMPAKNVIQIPEPTA